MICSFYAHALGCLQPDTRPSVACGWAGAVMLKNREKKNGGPTDRPTGQGTHPLIESLATKNLVDFNGKILERWKMKNNFIIFYTALKISQFQTIWLKKNWLLLFKRSFSGVSFPYIIIGIQVRNDQDMMSTLITSCIFPISFLTSSLLGVTAPKRVAWF